MYRVVTSLQTFKLCRAFALPPAAELVVDYVVDGVAQERVKVPENSTLNIVHQHGHGHHPHHHPHHGPGAMPLPPMPVFPPMPVPSAPPAMPGGGVVGITAASYGSGARRVDVTQMVRQYAAGGSVSFQVNRATMGCDPCPGVVKGECVST